MAKAFDEDASLFRALVGDGRALLTFFGVCLFVIGAFAVFLAATGHFLPHDVAFLGMTSDELCLLQGCRIVHFMQHDRVAFGGSMMAVGSMYIWLAEFPLRRGEAWAWWLYVVSGAVGFGSFLAYLGYGYLDTWHGVATLSLLPVFVSGLIRTRGLLEGSRVINTLAKPSVRYPWQSPEGIGRLCLIATALGMIAGGMTIMVVGMTSVFVPQDLSFMRVAVDELRAINPRLVPLIAHDRAGFGGGLASCGVTVLFSVWCGRPSKSLWQALCVAGIVGFSAAIGVHPAVGYTSFTHLAPAVAGALMFLVGLALSYKPMIGVTRSQQVQAAD